MKFSGKVGNGPVNKWLNFGGAPGRRLDTGIVFRIVSIGRYGKWLLVNKHLQLIMIRQVAALVR